MADGFIVRRGGAGKQALAPTITFVSKTDTQIVFTIKNNDTSTAVILWEIGDTTPDANSFELAADTTSSNITVTGLTQGTEYIVYATANVTGKIKSNVSELSITTDAIIYTAATGGTTLEYDDGGKRYRSHTFTSNGTFEVTDVGNDDRNQVDYLIIAGGGGGGGSSSSSNGGGGGGAGGYRTTLGTSGGNSSAESKVTVTVTSYGVTIGSGGSGGAASNDGVNGANSSVAFASTITSTGGGRGGFSTNSGATGGSGGAPGGNSAAGGTGAAGSGISGQGNNSGTRPAFQALGAGGGGAGGVGSNNGTGGSGLNNLLRTGSNETRAIGGTSAASPTPVSAGANTGSGGNGNTGGSRAGGNGGSGIVVIRYEIAPTT
jgi:hypothetical protein